MGLEEAAPKGENSAGGRVFRPGESPAAAGGISKVKKDLLGGIRDFSMGSGNGTRRGRPGPQCGQTMRTGIAGIVPHPYVPGPAMPGDIAHGDCRNRSPSICAR